VLRKRIAAFIILLFFIFTSLLSGIYIISHTNHEHDRNASNGGCAVCLQIKEAVHILSQLRLAVVSMFIIIIYLFILVFALGSLLSFFEADSLIKLKVRMNN